MKAALVSSWGTPKKYLGAFLDTAKRHGLNPQNFDDTDWPGRDWTEIPWYRKSEGQARFVREHRNDYDVFMFTDSYDIVFACGWDEILTKYQALDSPIVFGAEVYPWPMVAQKDLYPDTSHRCRFLNAGFWIGTTDAAMALLDEMEKIAARREQCDQGIAVDAFLSGRHPIKLDTACSLLFCCNLDSLDKLDLSGVRPVTTDTLQKPCMFHGNGNSPLTGVITCLNRWVPSPEEETRMSE